jgi:hypothetical protein
MAKVKLKAETVGVRMPSKLRYGLELLARRNNLTLSGQIIRAAEQMLEEAGLTSRPSGELVSSLDKLWSDDVLERALSLSKYAPELLTDDQRTAVTYVDFIDDFKDDLTKEQRLEKVRRFLTDGTPLK